MFRAIILGLFALPVAVMAAERNDIPSCYTLNKVEEFKVPPSGRMLTVIVDQTTPLDEGLQRKAWANIKNFVKPGDKLRLYSFSAYLDGRYTKLEYAGELEQPLRTEDMENIPIGVGRKFGSCISQQQQFAWKGLGRAFAGSMGQSSNTIPRSEILYSLKEISKDMAKSEQVNENVVFLISDMLEFSDFGSFYASNSIRQIDAEVEQKKVAANNLYPDFAGARVYVHGAAFVPTGQKYGYRSGKMIQSLNSFWTTYFEKSNATLSGFGTPELTTAVQ